MPSLRSPLILAAGILLGCLLASPAPAWQPRPKTPPGGGVFRQEINNGATTTVRYYGIDLSPGEITTIRQLEQVENELAYARGLQALKRQYVNDERFLEVHRREMQRLLYGLDITRTSYGSVALGGYGGYGGLYPVNLGYLGYGGYGYGSPFAGAAYGGGTSTVTQTLAEGVGDEGAIKNAMARVMALQSTPEYVARLDRDWDRVVMRASSSPSLAVALGVPPLAEMRKERAALGDAEGEIESAYAVTLTLKDGSVVHGTKMRETKDWFIVTREGGGTTRVRPSEVVRIDDRTGKVGPASD
jgi:hypothetical protein